MLRNPDTELSTALQNEPFLRRRDNSCKNCEIAPRGARTPDGAHIIKILALILYVHFILAGGIAV